MLIQKEWVVHMVRKVFRFCKTTISCFDFSMRVLPYYPQFPFNFDASPFISDSAHDSFLIASIISSIVMVSGSTRCSEYHSLLQAVSSTRSSRREFWRSSVLLHTFVASVIKMLVPKASLLFVHGSSILVVTIDGKVFDVYLHFQYAGYSHLYALRVGLALVCDVIVL